MAPDTFKVKHIDDGHKEPAIALRNGCWHRTLREDIKIWETAKRNKIRTKSSGVRTA